MADANNGNWRTAQRWQRFLSSRYAVTVAPDWRPGDEPPPDLMIALHARRSADPLARFVEAGAGPAILVLTGTDVYRDLATDASARASLTRATRLVLLEPEGLERLPSAARDKAEVILQSSPTLARRTSDPRTFDLVMVAHLRDEKDPLTAWHAFERVSRTDTSIRFVQIGSAMEPRYEAAAEALAARNPRFRWTGPLSHALTRQQIRRARLLVVPSLMEGGANVVGEAITSGTPVLASDVPGNRGLLGRDYAGTFPVGDDAALAALIERARRSPDFMALLARQCAERAPLFRPERERTRLITLVGSCLSSHPASASSGAASTASSTTSSPASSSLAPSSLASSTTVPASP